MEYQRWLWGRKDLVLPNRYERLSVSATEPNLRKIIRPVTDALKEFDDYFQRVQSTQQGLFVPLAAPSGMGKSTFLSTLPFFRSKIQVRSIREDAPLEDIFQELGRLHKDTADAELVVVVIEGRESPQELEAVRLRTAMASINRWVRSATGRHTVVVWNCVSTETAKLLAATAQEIGGSSLSWDRKPVLSYSGPAKSEWLSIVKGTVALLNAGATPEEYGITAEDLEKTIKDKQRIGDVLSECQSLWQERAREVEARLTSITPVRMWVVLAVQSSEIAQEVAALTRGVSNVIDIDRVLAASDTNESRFLRERIGQAGIAATMLDLRLVFVSPVAWLKIVTTHMDGPLSGSLGQKGFKRYGGSKTADQLLKESQLWCLLNDLPYSIQLKRGRRPDDGGALAQFNTLVQHAVTRDGDLNRCLGRALEAAGILGTVDYGKPRAGAWQVHPDISVATTQFELCLEVMWRAGDARQGAIAGYVCDKLKSYVQNLGFW